MSDEGATSQACLEGLQARLKELLANEDYAGAAAIKEEMRVAEVTATNTRRWELESKLAELLAQEDYRGAAAVKEEIRAIAVAPQVPLCQRGEMRMASATEQARERTRRGELETKLAELLAQ